MEQHNITSDLHVDNCHLMSKHLQEYNDKGYKLITVLYFSYRYTFFWERVQGKRSL